MRLSALVDGPDHVCCRYRIEAFRPLWERAGFSLQTLSLPRRWWGRLATLARDSFDVAILQRRLLSPVDLRLLRQRSRFLIFDFDDAVWLRDSYASRGMHSRRRLRRFAATIRFADVIIAGNEFLAAQATRFAPAARVYLIPTCVDPTPYPLADHRRRNTDVQLVWVGSSSTLQGLERFDTTLDEIGRRVPGVRLKLICDRFISFRDLPVDPRPWSRATETGDIATADIGVAWMPDDDWSRGKCGLKVLQYMAAGLPVIANPVGVLRDLVAHGETGLLAESRQDWVDAVRMLAGDPERRRAMGAAGRRRVEHQFSVELGADRWLKLLEALRRQAA